MTNEMKKLLGSGLSQRLARLQYGVEFRIINAHQFPRKRRSVIAWWRSSRIYRQIDKRVWYYDVVSKRNIYRPVWRF